MKKLTKIKILWDRFFNKIVKVDNIEKVEEGLSRQKEALKKLNESYYNAKGTLDTYKDELKKNENNLKSNNCTLEEQAIINILKINPATTQEEIAVQINKSLRTVKTYMAEMQEKGLIERKNGKKNGEWYVNITNL